ncbi:MAG: ORF6N domain-containing protein [Cytophagales bacterium]|nr:ORF6N domain-containing protein [Cytophagales bacterium]
MGQDGIVSESVITSKIYVIRGRKVMLDRDLSELYGVEVKRLNEQVKRNKRRFPSHYMFQLTKEEYTALRSQSAILKRGGHRKYMPYAFTEQGVAMLSSVLNSDTAIKISIQIIDAFVKMREAISQQPELRLILEKLQEKMKTQDLINEKVDGQIRVIFEYIQQLTKPEENPRRRIGFHKET